MSVSNFIHQVQQHSDIVKVAAVGTTGTSASVLLQDFNQLMAGLAGAVTFIYICIKIYQALRPPKGGK